LDHHIARVAGTSGEVIETPSERNNLSLHIDVFYSRDCGIPKKVLRHYFSPHISTFEVLLCLLLISFLAFRLLLYLLLSHFADVSASSSIVG
jgi:hypothetical protein